MLRLIDRHGQGSGRSLRRFAIPEVSPVAETLAGSEVLDPERPAEMFEPFAHGGLFRKGSLVSRALARARRGFAR